MPSLARDITTGEELRVKLAQGVEAAFEVAKSAYGPGAGNALLEINWGYPQISRDGVNNLRKVHLEEPVANMAARTIILSSEASNRKVGDGTTASVILAHALYTKANENLAAGINRMEISRLIEKTAQDVVKQIDEMKIDVTPKMLNDVAIISAGDEALGTMIAEAIKSVGVDGGITVDPFDGIGVYSDLVQGFYYRKGFTYEGLINNPSMRESRIENADILITDKTLKTVADIGPIINTVIKHGGRGSELLIIGEVQDDALNLLVENTQNGNIRPTVADVPATGAAKTLFLADLATLTGATVVKPGTNGSTFTIDMLGGADKVVINAYSTSIVGGQGAKEDIDTLIDNLKSQLESAESQIDIDSIRGRLSRLTGKIVNIHVGGATPVERDEVKLRVDDAVCAVQAALKGGIVPGGGVTLAHVKVDNNLSDAFKKPLSQLVENSGYNVEKALYKVTESKDIWMGYNLRDPEFDYKLEDLRKVGVIDPALVVKEVVLNASSVVSKLITTSVAITFKDRSIKDD